MMSLGVKEGSCASGRISTTLSGASKPRLTFAALRPPPHKLLSCDGLQCLGTLSHHVEEIRKTLGVVQERVLYRSHYDR
jgi:hypothetical protein